MSVLDFLNDVRKKRIKVCFLVLKETVDVKGITYVRETQNDTHKS